MPVDTQAATGSDADRTQVAAPSLTPIQVASGPEVEQKLRSARASLASLNLKVRTAARAADLAEDPTRPARGPGRLCDRLVSVVHRPCSYLRSPAVSTRLSRVIRAS